MRIALLVVQVLLGAHTLIGALWKVSNAESQVPSLAALPHALWLGLGGVEVLAALVLVVGAMARPLARGVPRRSSSPRCCSSRVSTSPPARRSTPRWPTGSSWP
jgi:hypothetical protein